MRYSLLLIPKYLEFVIAFLRKYTNTQKLSRTSHCQKILNIQAYFFYCASQIKRFLQIENFWQSCVNQFCVPFFQQHLLTYKLVSLCHILIIIPRFQTLSSLLNLLRWSVISDLWYYYCNWFGVPQSKPIWESKINKCCVCSDCSSNSHSCLSPSP